MQSISECRREREKGVTSEIEGNVCTSFPNNRLRPPRVENKGDKCNQARWTDYDKGDCILTTMPDLTRHSFHRKSTVFRVTSHRMIFFQRDPFLS